MLKENTVITLHPEDMFRLHAILLDEDRGRGPGFSGHRDQEEGGCRQQTSLPPGL